ncbi:hypothetical protein EDF56_10324 [Novosphingobium sp. PhB165]|uniref:hypothetical protein n=1 Tax=Novosphingobium sp. PhB165 TaxID=2485105 RepID=UPI001053096D|nr:hypothetical protein [Novosphingobium sp. PhB165]TCM19389.1 hypothetical protein EDF56_10324 [Novosphingobium sp. PhB165]
MPRNPKLDERTCRMICPIAAAMVGVCLTAIGIIQIKLAVQGSQTFADDLLSLDAVLFLVATLSAYFALRGGSERRLFVLEHIADVSFITAMTLMAGVCIFITYAFSV